MKIIVLYCTINNTKTKKHTMKKPPISESNFRFQSEGYGHYQVIFTSPATGKQWSKTSTDMELIDLTKNEDYPKIKDLNRLKRFCKN